MLVLKGIVLASGSGTKNQDLLKGDEMKVQIFGRGFAWLDIGFHDY